MRRTWLLLVVLWVGGLAAAQEDLPFFEDFQGRNFSEWGELPDHVVIEDGVLKLTNVAEDELITYVQVPVLARDFQLSFDASFSEDREFATFGVIFREDPEYLNSYVLAISPAENQIVLKQITDGEFLDEVVNIAFDAVDAGNHRYTLTVVDDLMALQVDGELAVKFQIEPSDLEIIELVAGVYAEESTPETATFDNVEVTSAAARDIPEGEFTTLSATEVPTDVSTNETGDVVVEVWQSADPADIVDELRSLDIVPNAGESWVSLRETFKSGRGNFFVPIGREARFQDVALGGTMTFNRGSDDTYEDCYIGARLDILDDGTVNDGMFAGIDSNNKFYIIEQSEGKFLDGIEIAADEFDGERVTLLLTVVGDRATLFANGVQKLIFDLSQRGEGKLGLGLAGAGANALCQADDFWAYQFD